MKELTIEEKAARYDEALKKAKDMLSYKEVRREDMEYLFPELAESEDERIRKELIDFLKEEEAKADITSKRSETLCKYIVWLEKQGEQKETLCDKCRKEQPSHSCQDITALGRCALEKQGEQKLADKLEPKFKVGDWVVYNRNDNSREIMQIYDIKDGRYYFTDNVHFSWSVKECDEKSHFWTIEDAKDGDVLSYRDGQWIFIYKGILIENIFKYYALLSEKGITVNDAASCCLTSCITPATKKQHDTLIKAIIDAGYTSNFEEKS